MKEKNRTKIIKRHSKPEILVSTPLLPGDEISKITKQKLKRNRVPFTWVSTEANQNIPMNHLESISWYKNKFNKLPPYIFFLDRDIEPGRGLLDRLHSKLKNAKTKPTEPKIGFSYATFQFKGYLNKTFLATKYDINRLIQSNYISSNSLFKSEVIEQIGLVTDYKYKRLLDWAFLLKCLAHGYIGISEPKAWFIAHSTENDISAGSDEDYRIKHQAVYFDFILPLFKQN